jgi:Ser/Thr protein kinase RdoA (MazF antagonist)
MRSRGGVPCLAHRYPVSYQCRGTESKKARVLPDKPIAYGRTAEIYPWRNHQVLKLFHEWFPAEAIHNEARIARAVQAAGLAVPQVGEIVEVDGRLGLAYQRLEGASMGEEMAARPWRLGRLAQQLAELHARMHDTGGIEGMPPQRERLESKIRQAKGLSVTLQESLLQALEGMPTGDCLCHGDFHPWNVLMTAGGAVVIDWDSATCGNPLADVARTAVLLAGVSKMSEMVTWREKLAARWCRRVYLGRYFKIRPGGEEECRAWRPIVAAARMSEGIPGLENWLRAQAGSP